MAVWYLLLGTEILLFMLLNDSLRADTDGLVEKVPEIVKIHSVLAFM